MAVLDAAARNALPAGQFGLPASRGYPMPDQAHAVNAEGRAKQQLNRGNLSPEQYRHIMAMALRIAGPRAA